MRLAKNPATTSLLLAVLTACGPQTQEPPTVPPPYGGTVKGRLATPEDVGAEGAACTLEGTAHTTTSGADGTFSFTRVDPGPFQVLCRKGRFSLLRPGAVPEVGATVDLGALELRASGAISGVVRQNGWEDASGIRVVLMGLSLATVTDAQGRFLLEGVPEGTYQPLFMKAGFQTGYAPVTTVVSGETTVLQAAFIAPAQNVTGSLTVAEGQRLSRSRTVSVTLSATAGASLYQLSEHPGFPSAQWQPLTTRTEWTFSADGTQRLHARFADAQGRVGNFAVAELVVDSEAPEGSVGLQGGGDTRGVRDITLVLAARDAVTAVTSMRVGEGTGLESAPWEPFSGTRAWTLSDTEGPRDLFAQFMDTAGNTSAPVRLTVTLDRTPPGNPRLVLGRETGFTHEAEIDVVALAEGASEVVLSGDGDFDPEAWLEVGAYHGRFTLSPGDGVKTVHARFRDAVGNVSEPISAQVVLDTQVPTQPVPTETSARTSADYYTLVLAEPSQDANFSHYEVRRHFNEFFQRTEAVNHFFFTFPAEGTYVLQVVAVDLAGNRSAEAWVPVTYSTATAP